MWLGCDVLLVVAVLSGAVCLEKSGNSPFWLRTIPGANIMKGVEGGGLGKGDGAEADEPLWTRPCTSLHSILLFGGAAGWVCEQRAH